MKRIKKKFSLNTFIAHLVLGIFAAGAILPIIVVIATSLSTERNLIINGYSLFPQGFTVRAFTMIFERPTQLLTSYGVTILITLLGTGIGMMMTTALAYAMSRKDFPYRNKISFYVFFTMLFSGGMIPWYILISRALHMNDTIFALFIPYLIIPWHVMLMKGFLSDVPISLIESAKIDGANEYAIYWRIVLPISKAGIATVSLFTVLMFWNDYYLSLFFIQSSKFVSLQFLLYRIMSNLDFLNSALAAKSGMQLSLQELPGLSARMAMCILAAGPMFLIFPFFQKYFVKGITVGAVKG